MLFLTHPHLLNKDYADNTINKTFFPPSMEMTKQGELLTPLI